MNKYSSWFCFFQNLALPCLFIVQVLNFLRTCYSTTVERCPDNPMLGRREILDGKVNKSTVCVSDCLLINFDVLYLVFDFELKSSYCATCLCSLVNTCGKLIKKYMNWLLKWEMLCEVAGLGE